MSKSVEFAEGKTISTRGRETKIVTSSGRKVFAPIPPDVECVGKIVLDAAHKVQTVLGPGLLKSVYGIVLKHIAVDDLSPPE